METMHEVTVRPQRRWLQRMGMVIVVLAVCGATPRAFGASLTLDAAKTATGTVQLCVGLDSAGAKVAGTQNDLVWDASCANLKANTCAAVPDSKKPLHGNTPANLQSTYRALVFALDNVEPIRDGKLYCCEFELKGGGDACCAVKFDRLGASDPVGNALGTTGNPEKLCLATGAAAVEAAAPPAAPPAPAPGPETGSRGWLWVLLIGVIVVVIAVLVMRGRAS
jgi:hypothetical protein